MSTHLNPPPSEAPQTLANPLLFRDRLKSGGHGPAMVVMPPGQFLMGSPPSELEREKQEGPQHLVAIAKPFAIVRYAVTFADFDLYTHATQQEPMPDLGFGRNLRPVIEVTWRQAKAYCAWLIAQTGHRYRLPSEAEWEYACRAGTTTPFACGDTLSTAQANYQGNWGYGQGSPGEFRGMPVPVNQFEANDFGLYQMHGNVWEWCEDNWHRHYKGAPHNGRPWLKNSRERVLRGGSFNDQPGMLRSAYRYGYKETLRWCNIGFHVVRVLYP